MFGKVVIVLLAFALVFTTTNTVFAETNTSITPIDESIGIEKTIVPFSAPKNNKLPWGYVEGKIANPVEGHPVIIQIYRDGEAVHFAQTSVNEDGTYHYEFRVLSVSDGKTTRIFDGDYTVKIFKVVHLTGFSSV